MIRSISIDDEPLAHKVIQTYCNDLDFIEVIQTFKSAVDAMGYLRTNPVDLIFLDINMPVLKGLDFLRTLNNPPPVIITSAHKEYALDGYELNVTDYLLKPFGFERFLKAVNKVEIPDSTPNIPPQPAPSSGRIFVRSDKKSYQVQLGDILFLESAGSYVKIHLSTETLMVLDRLANFEARLPNKDFLRVHKSFIVGIAHIRTIEGNRIFAGEKEIPVGQVYKANLKKLLG